MSRPRVALDARWLQQKPRGGVGRSIANLLPHLADEADLHLLLDADWPTIASDLPVSYLPTAVRSAAWWMQVPAVRWLRNFDGIYHTPWYGLSFIQPVPMVVNIWDLVFETHPEWYRPGGHLSFRVQARWAARTARTILTPSETIRQEILEHKHYPVAPDDVVVTPLGVDAAFTPDADPGLAKNLIPPSVSERYLVAIGGAARRQPDVAIAAWRDVTRSGEQIGLVIVGGPPPQPEPGLVHLADLDDAQWASVLAGAEAFVYPTLYEGFGMPATEAIAAGTPVVCAPVGALPEVLGPCAQWCSSPTPEAMAQELADLLGDSARRNRLREQGLTRARSMTWDLAASRTLAAYRAAAS